MSNQETVIVKGGVEQIKAFMHAFFDAPDDADLDIRVGYRPSDPSEKLLILSIEVDGEAISQVFMNSTQTRVLAGFVLDTMSAYPEAGHILANLLLGLRQSIEAMGKL